MWRRLERQQIRDLERRWTVMKKVTALLLSLFLVFGMSTTALADEVTIRTTVPERHTVNVQAEGGKIIANNQVCQGSVKIERQRVQSWWIVPDAGMVLSALYYNGEDVMAQVRAGVFTAPALTDDATLEAIFANAPSTPRDEQYDVSGTITGPDGKPVPGAAVDIGGQTGTTDENGNFTVKDVPPGTHTVTVTDQDGNVIGIGEITIEDPQGGSMTVTTDSNGNPMIVPGNSTTMISLTLTVGEDGVIAIGDVEDATPAREESEEPEDTEEPAASDDKTKPSDDKTGASGGRQGSSDGKAETSGGKSLQTGDMTDPVLWLALLCISAAVLGIAGIERKRKKSE